MTRTQNYNLSQWDPVDRILREDFNADNAAIDAALGTLATAKGFGNCRVDFGNIIGNGGYGSGSPTKLNIFGNYEKLRFLVIFGPQLLMVRGPLTFKALSIHPGSSGDSLVADQIELTPNARGTQLTFYANNARDQANLKDVEYTVIYFCDNE